MFEKYDKVVVYGAGKYAYAVYRYFYSRNEVSKISYFVVSDLNENSSLFYGLPVKKYEDVAEKLKDQNVIIALKDSDNILAMLQRDGIESKYVITPQDKELLESEWNEFCRGLPIQQNKVFFICHNGRGYECNCKYIAEKLIEEKQPVELIWKVIESRKYVFPEQVKEVEYLSMQYYLEYSTAQVIVSNNESAFEYKNPKTYFINTWHGTGPFKKVMLSEEKTKNNKQLLNIYRRRLSLTDLYISNSKDNSEMFRESMMHKGEILECGSPRNDILFHKNGIKQKVYQILGIAESKKILFYAPTFRDKKEDSFKYYDLDMDKVLRALQHRFGEEYQLLYRFHQNLRQYKQFTDFYVHGINVTEYPDVMELVVASDILITDYSSIMWDFSLQRRPVFLYHNDEQEYMIDRDFYCPVSQWPYIKAHTSEEMCNKILEFDEEDYIEKLERFFRDDPSYDDGHASERVVARIMDVIRNPKKYGKE